MFEKPPPHPGFVRPRYEDFWVKPSDVHSGVTVRSPDALHDRLDAVSHIFGDDVRLVANRSPNIQAMAGNPPPGSDVWYGFRRRDLTAATSESERFGDLMWVTFENRARGIDGAIDYIRRPAGRGLSIHGIDLATASSREGVSVTGLVDLVTAARSRGVRDIRIKGAAGFLEGFDATGKELIPATGYRTWARIGFNGPLRAVHNAEGHRTRLFAELDRAGLGEYKRRTLRDLVTHPEGKRIWREHGWDISMKMDLRSGSEDLKVFGKYLSKFGERTARLAEKHTPLIEGLRHGGVAQKIRKALTSFGSGWRGMVSVGEGWGSRLFGNSIAFTVSSPDLLVYALSDKATKSMPRGLRTQITEALEWADKTGLSPVFVNKDLVKGKGFGELSRIVRHERIHSLHYSNASDEFFRTELTKAGSLSESVEKGATEMMLAAAKQRGLDVSSTRVVEGVHQNVQQYVKEVTPQYSLYGAPGDCRFDSERLAWSNQMDRGFFRRAKAAGLDDPRALTTRVMKTGRSQAMVHAGTGLVSKVVAGARRMLRSL